jgi:hypothetical protein
MGNIFKNGRAPGVESLSMSNGATAVVIEVLVLAGSRLARTDWEKSWVVWLAEHDQAVVGRGAVGFDMRMMGWTRPHFDEEKAFVLRVVDAAGQKLGWETRDCEPNGEVVTLLLERFRQLVESVTAEHIVEDWGPDAWVPEAQSGYPTCSIHGALLHHRGCILCNDD